MEEQKTPNQGESHDGLDNTRQMAGPLPDTSVESQGEAPPVHPVGPASPAGGWSPGTGRYGSVEDEDPVHGSSPGWGTWEYLYHVLVQPKLAFTAAANEKPLLLAIAVVLVTSIISLITNMSMGVEDIARALPEGRLPKSVVGSLSTAMGLISVFMGIIMWLFLAGFYNLMGELFGGHGNAKGLLTAMGIAYLPSIFVSPLRLVGSLLPGGSIIEGFGVFALAIWGMILQVIAIRQTLCLSTSRSIIVFVLPIMLMVLFIIVLVLSLISLIPFFQGLPAL